MNNKTHYGSLNGNLKIDSYTENDKTFVMIYGDPEGLKSLGEILIKLSQINQNDFKEMLNGDREHLHIYPDYHLSNDSNETIIGRLDAKGTGEFPSNFEKK